MYQYFFILFKTVSYLISLSFFDHVCDVTTSIHLDLNYPTSVILCNQTFSKVKPISKIVEISVERSQKKMNFSVYKEKYFQNMLYLCHWTTDKVNSVPLFKKTIFTFPFSEI